MARGFRFSVTSIGISCAACLYAVSLSCAAEETLLPPVAGVYALPATPIPDREMATIRARGAPGVAVVQVAVGATPGVRLWDEIVPPLPQPLPQQAKPVQNNNTQRAVVTMFRR